MSSFVKLPAPSPNSWRYIQSCRWRQQKPSDNAGSSLRHRIRKIKKGRRSACPSTNSQAEGLLIGWCCSQQEPDFNQILTLPDWLRKAQALYKTLVYKNQICLPFLDKVCFWESSYSILLFLKMPCGVKKKNNSELKCLQNSIRNGVKLLLTSTNCFVDTSLRAQ